MREQVISPRLYQGPRQEKQYRKQRQLLHKEQQIVDFSDRQETQSTALVPITESKPIPRASVPTQTVRSNIPLIILAYCWGLAGLGLNAWFSFGQGSNEANRVIFLSIGFITEASMFFLLAHASTLWVQRLWGRFVTACLLWPLLFVFALTNSLGFASLNLTEASTARAERITPAVADAQRRLDTLTASRSAECLKRGDKCRQLEKEEQSAIEALRDAREKVSATADPQIASAAKLIAWASLDRFHPSADDFAMLRLLLLTLLPQLGGLVLMVASSRQALSRSTSFA
jgi:hypothetical protein